MDESQSSPEHVVTHSWRQPGSLDPEPEDEPDEEPDCFLPPLEEDDPLSFLPPFEERRRLLDPLLLPEPLSQTS